MKILELNFEKTWRGGERQTLYCMRGFREKGIEVSVLCRAGYPMHNKAAAEGFDTYSFSSVIHVILFLLFKGRRFDILHAETAGVLTYCILTKPFHRTKVVYSRRVDFVPAGFLTWLKYRLTDKLTAISVAIKDIIHDFSKRNALLISDIVVEQQLNKKRALADLERYGIPSHKKIVGNIAAFVPHKDPLTMVETIRHLAILRDDFVCVHFGAGELEDQVRAKVKEYNLADKYIMPGFTEHVEDFFSVFDVFVMSSEEEGLGSSVLDAFLYKVPVVATGAGGLKDLLANDRGLMTGIKQPEKLAAGIHEVLDNKAENSAMVESAYAYAKQYHSPEYIVQQYIDCFKNLLAEN